MSVVQFDPKGEVCEATAMRRIEMGYEVHCLDPYGTVRLDIPKATFNPLSMIQKESATAVDDCWDFAKAMVVRTGEEKDPHFNDAAETFISTMMAATVQFSQGDYKSLQTVRETLTNADKMKAAIDVAKESGAWGGALSRMGHQLAQFQGDEAASVKTTVNRHMRVFDSPAMQAVMRKSSFNPEDLRRKRMVIYIVPGLEHARVLVPWVRMCLTAFMKACIRGGLA